MDTVKVLEHYHQDPQFRQALQLFQKGEWEPGLAEVEALEKKYPLEHELRQLRQEMQIRSRVDEYERHDRTVARMRKMRNLTVRLGTLAVVLVLALFAYRQYSAWLSVQVMNARVAAEVQLQQVELAAKFHDAQVMVRAGRTDAALLLLDEIARVVPDYPGLKETRSEALRLLDTDASYTEAKKLLEAGDSQAALEILEGIPRYKDSQLLIDRIKSQSLYGDLLAQADDFYTAGQWEEAIDKYETVHSLDPSFQAERVEESLFTSYISAAKERLANEPDSLAALEASNEYFQKALELRPTDVRIRTEQAEARRTIEARLVQTYIEAAQAALTEEGDSLEALQTSQEYLTKALQIYPEDANIKVQLDLALAYMRAQDSFSKSRWPEVVGDLEFVYSEDPAYAAGTARQTLYEAYLALGDIEEAAGSYEGALTYFEKAASLAQADLSSPLRLYEAQIRTARVHGALGQYEDGVPLYRSAIELGGQADLAEADDTLAAKLDQADRYAKGGNYRTAFRLFREIVEKYPPDYDEVKVTIQTGDYLTSLANRLHTTVGAILEANPNINPKNLKPGDEIIIPTLPGEQTTP